MSLKVRILNPKDPSKGFTSASRARRYCAKLRAVMKDGCLFFLPESPGRRAGGLRQPLSNRGKAYQQELASGRVWALRGAP